MGLFSRFRRNIDNKYISDGSLDTGGNFSFLERALDESEIQFPLSFLVLFVISLLTLRLFIFANNNNHINNRGTQTLRSRGEHVLNIPYMNDVLLFKEVFLVYLNAAILEPILSIGSLDVNEISYGTKVMTNLFELLSLSWWVWLLTDAFDSTDVMFQYKFHYEFRPEIEADVKKYDFIRLRYGISKSSPSRQQPHHNNTIVQQSKLSLSLGSLQRDIALWYSLGAIATAWLPGAIITHRDVLHAYIVVVMWTIMHHYLQRATTGWGINYFYTLVFPSTALMPIEYCTPLLDTADIVTDAEFVATYRQFVLDRTGVSLIIQT